MEIDLWVFQSCAAGILPSIVPLCEDVLYCSLCLLDLRTVSVQISSIGHISGEQHTALSLCCACTSPYNFPILLRSCDCVAMIFLSLQHLHHSACTSSNDLFRNSSTAHDRPREEISANEVLTGTLESPHHVEHPRLASKVWFFAH